MEFLKFLEGIQTPFLDTVFSLITHLGEETVFILAGLLFFWCINKKHGYYLLSVGFLGTVINQFLKLLFRVPRPWVKDESFTIVESAREEATGYSFPSGHTQISVGVFGGIARFAKKWVCRIVCIAICILVPLSRMYLGVHTPADVGVSIVAAVILIFAVYPLIGKVMKSKKGMRIFFGVLSGICVLFICFVLFYPFPADIDMNNYNSGVKTAWQMFGCTLGLWMTYEIDEKYLHFETKAVWWVQILKLVLGLIPVLLIKSLLKQPLYALFNGNYFADSIRYFAITAFAGCVWPITFKWFGKLGKVKK